MATDSEGTSQKDETNPDYAMMNRLMDNLPAFVAYVNSDTLVYEFANRMYESSFGVPHGKIVGRHVRDVVGEAGYQAALPYIEDARRGKSASYQRLFDFKQGKRWVKVNYAPLFDKAGKVVSIIVLSYDITEQKSAEEKVKTSETRLRAILDATPFPIALVDLEDDRIEFWSRSATALFGHTAPTATEWYMIAYPDQAYRQEVIGRWKPFLKKARASGQTMNAGEYRVTCRDGSVRICELYVTFISDNLIITFNDITETKKAEEEMKQQKQFVESLINLSQDISYIYDLIDKKNIYANDGIRRMLGYSIEEIQKMGDKLLSIVMHPDDMNKYVREIIPKYATAKNGEIIPNEYRMKHKNGNWVWLECSEQIYKRMPDGTPQQIFGVIHNITERKQAEERIEFANDALQEKIVELEKFNKIAVDRELKMIELKQTIDEMRKERD